MSVFKLKQLAEWLNKDERTIRRWCIAGRIKGAFQTKGGHWRVRTEKSGALAVSKIERGLKRSPSRGAKRKFQPRCRVEHFKSANKAVKKLGRFLARGRGKYFLKAVDAIDENAECLNITHDDRLRLIAKLREPTMAAQFSDRICREVYLTAAGIWHWRAEDQKRRGISGAASVAGIPRSTFRNYFASFLPSRSDAQSTPQAHDEIDFDSMDERLGWAEPGD